MILMIANLIANEYFQQKHYEMALKFYERIIISLSR